MTSVLKGILVGIGILFVIALMPFSFWKSIEATDLREASFSVSDGTTVVIEAGDGQVDIVGIAGATEIKVAAEVQTWGNSESQAQGNLNNVDLIMEQSGNEIKLIHNPQDTNSIHRLESGGFGYGIEIGRNDRVNFVVEVPLLTNLDIHMDDGNVVINNVEGSIEFYSDNGDVMMDSFVGSVDVHTDDGDIYFTGQLVGSTHSIVTDDGDVELTLPASSSLEIEMEIDDGRLDSDFPLITTGNRKHFRAELNDSLAKLRITIKDDGDLRLIEQSE